MCELIIENFEDPINQILLAAAIVSIIIGCVKEGFPNGLIDGISIFIALFIISAVNSVNNIVSEKKLRDLISISKH